MRRLVLPATLLVVLVVGAAAWVAWTGLQARDRLVAASASVAELRAQVAAGQVDRARVTVRALQDDTRDARERTSGPLWTVARHLPVVADDVSAVASAAQVVDDVARHALPPAVDAAGLLDPAALQPRDGRIALEPVEAAAPLLREAADRTRAAAQAADGIATDGVHARVAAPVAELRRQLAEAAGAAEAAAQAGELLPAMLGAQEPRTYLLLFQNNAEARATGGLPGAFALLTADDGRIQLVRQASSGDLPRFDEPVLDVPPEVLALHGRNLVTRVSDINLTPDFPLTAGLAREMWSRRFGQQVDGVISTDPVALSYLLEATGPVPLPTGDQLTAGNAVPLLLAEVYSRYRDSGDQDGFFALAAASVFTAMTEGEGDPRALLTQLARAAREHRVLVWSAREHEQEVLEGTPLGGSLEASSEGAGLGVYLNDATRAKLSYYLQPAVAVRAVDCSSGAGAWEVSVTLTSTVPGDAAAALPPYVLGSPDPDLAPGTVRTEVLVYAPVGGVVESVAVDGERVPIGAHVEGGRAVAETFVDVAPGGSVTLSAYVTSASEPVGTPELRTTPGVRPISTDLTASACA